MYTFHYSSKFPCLSRGVRCSYLRRHGTVFLQLNVARVDSADGETSFPLGKGVVCVIAKLRGPEERLSAAHSSDTLSYFVYQILLIPLQPYSISTSGLLGIRPWAGRWGPAFHVTGRESLLVGGLA